MVSRKAWEAVADRRNRPLAHAKPAGKGQVAIQGPKTPYASFPAFCRASGVAVPVAELRFAPPRRWRFDFAWPEQRVALEIDGGLFAAGAHVRGARVLATHEKLNAAAALGWRVLYTHPQGLPAMLPLLKQVLG